MVQAEETGDGPHFQVLGFIDNYGHRLIPSHSLLEVVAKEPKEIRQMIVGDRHSEFEENFLQQVRELNRGMKDKGGLDLFA